MDPGPGHKFEVFSDAAIKDQSLGRVRRIEQAYGIADAVIALFVEALAAQIWAAPITRRDVGTTDSNFELVPGGDQLEHGARHRDADHAGALHHEVRRG